MTTIQKTTPGERVGKYILRSAEAFFSADRWNYGPKDPKAVETRDCICCASVRARVVSHDYSSKDLFWLVDVSVLKHVVGVKDRTRRCRFCSIIYQAFWSSQPGNYRLRSQLWAQGPGPNDPNDWESKVSKMPRVWGSMYAKLEDSGAITHFPADWYDASGCGSCLFCRQDRQAELPVTGPDQLCETCSQATSRFRQADDTENVELRPVIPLLLRLNICTAGTTFSTLQVRHAGGATIGSANGDSPFYEWKVYTHEDDPAAACVPAFHAGSYDEDAVYLQLAGWLRQCKEHKACRNGLPEQPVLPRRVIEVDKHEARLVETIGDTAQYVALSYCWGGPQPFRLRQSNKAQYEHDLVRSTLPKTIRDALCVTEKLGFRYIWIDSMCIIQDDEDDKLAEINKMQSIYSNASLVLCASAPSNCEQGFLDAGQAPGDSPLLPDNGTLLRCALPDGSAGTLRLIDRAEYRQSEEPLFSRGWTLQESLLPTRLIRFGACLSWECKEASVVKTISSLRGGIDQHMDFHRFFRWHESLDADVRKMLHAIPLQPSNTSTIEMGADMSGTNEISLKSCPAIDMERMRERTLAEMMEHCTCDDHFLWAAWKTVVETYSDRLLTSPADKLPAIAGLAQRFESISGDRYLAGVWESRLIHDLMWTASPPVRARSRRPWRRVTGRAPTWSWASLDAHIEVVGPHKRISKCQLWYAEPVSRKEIATVVSCEIDLLYEHLAFGPVTGGLIVIHGPIRKARLRQGRFWRYLAIDGYQFTPAVSDTKTLEPDTFAKPFLDLGHAAESQDFASSGDQDVWCLQMRQEQALSKIVGGEATILDGLLLLPTDDTMSTFRRVGVWVTDWYVVVGEEQHPFAKLDPVNVTII